MSKLLPSGEWVGDETPSGDGQFSPWVASKTGGFNPYIHHQWGPPTVMMTSKLYSRIEEIWDDVRQTYVPRAYL